MTADSTTPEENDGVKVDDNAALPVGHYGGLHDFDSDDDRPRRVSFHEPLTTRIHPIPLRSPEETAELFYNRQDFASFQANEQRRYDKMMMKRIQQMVQVAMKDELEAAYDRNASPEEIDALMPQTTEEIFSLLGGITALDMPPPPSAVRAEPTYQSKADVEIQEGSSSSSSEIDPEVGLEQQTLEEEEQIEHKRPIRREAPSNQLEEFSDDAFYEIMGIEKDENFEPSQISADDACSSISTEGKEQMSKDQSPDGDFEREKRGRFRRPDHWIEATDDELYDLLGLQAKEESQTDETGKDENHAERRERFRRPDRWVEATDDELYDMLGLQNEETKPATRPKGLEDTNEESKYDDLNDVIHQKFHLGNDDPSELVMLKGIEKNEAINDVLGTSFSSDVHVEDLVPLSPKNSPRGRISPARSPRRMVAVPLVHLEGNLDVLANP